MKKYLLYLLSLCLSFGCTTETNLVKVNQYGSSLESGTDFKTSLFTLSNELLGATERETDITIELQSHSNGETIILEGEIREAAQTISGAMFIPNETTLEDSDYDVLFRHSNGAAFSAQFVIPIKDEMFCATLLERRHFTNLDGRGTARNPYIIKNANNFRDFIIGLKLDSVSRGAGLHFAQTADFDAPPMSTFADDEGYTPVPFAGHYNGGGYNINNLFYIGNSGQIAHNVGLFSELLDGAFIDSLQVHVSSIQYASCAGVIAGVTTGNVILSNIATSGGLTDMSDKVGGLVGYASQGTLTIQNCNSQTRLSGGNYIGGLVGMADNGITVVMQSDSVFKATPAGESYVGGAIGYLDGGILISDVVVSHQINDGSSKGVIADSTCAGGLIGYAQLRSKSSIKNVKISTPIESASYVGGLIGNFKPSYDIHIDGCQVTNSITGGQYVGGFFGSLSADSGNGVATLGRSNSILELNESIINVSSGTTYKDSENIGGLAGYCSGSHLRITSPVTIAVNVNGGTNVGGVFGNFQGSADDLVVSSTCKFDKAMKVDGKKNVGGIIGYASGLTLTDNITFNYSSYNTQPHITKPSSFSSIVGNAMLSENVGGLVGYAEKCHFRGLYVDGTVYGTDYVGGICGLSQYSDFKYCISDLTKFGTTGEYNGGIVGYLIDGNIDYCVNYSSLSNGSNYTGGIVGYSYGETSMVTLTNSVNVGSVSGSSIVGGLVGEANGDNTIRYCANYGSVSAVGSGGSNAADGLGGLVGWAYPVITIDGCSNHGDVSSTENHHGCGGIAGTLGKDADYWSHSESANKVWVTSTCNFGTISASGDTMLGGICGYLEEGDVNDWDMSHKHDHERVLIENCYNMGSIPSHCTYASGGIVGLISSWARVRLTYNVGMIPYGNASTGSNDFGTYFMDDSYYLAGTCSGGGTSLSEPDMKDLSKFKHFSDDIWRIGSYNDGYPYLDDCPFQFVTFSK